MSHAPFDGVILDDPRPPVPGALALLLHQRVEAQQARSRGRQPLGLEALESRAQACQELLAHGLLPETIRALARHGLDLGPTGAPRSLTTLLEHLEAYLASVDQAGYLEPDHALWQATTAHLEGHRGLWIERTPADGTLEAGLRDLQPARLRALGCLAAIGPVRFRLATRRGNGTSGLFGSTQPLVDWFMEGLEQHGHSFANDLSLAEPEGWTEAPWSAALEGLFERPLPLEAHRDHFRVGSVESPFDLLRHGVEQVMGWLDEGFAPAEITLVHPAPQDVAPFLEPLLAQEGVSLHVRGGLRPLLVSAAWSPLWACIQGLLHLDPLAFSAGLGASTSPDLRAWSSALAQADQNGTAAFGLALAPLPPRTRARAEALWAQLEPWRQAVLPARTWAEQISTLRSALKPGGDPEQFFSPHSLLLELWDATPWDFKTFSTALKTFLENAKDNTVPRTPGGVRLLSPSALVDDWHGSRATLVMDLSEGAWPARPEPNPDLDWERKAAINSALLRATAQEDAEAPFPRALQRFWLPRSEEGDRIPRAFQREAYGFNKMLALTRERFVALTPTQDAEGRMCAQGPFWTAMEGAALWELPGDRASSRFRATWEGSLRNPLADQRAANAVARPLAERLESTAPPVDRVPGCEDAWLRGATSTSPTALEGLARCPFRALAERVWHLGSFDLGGRLNHAEGTLVHALLQEVLTPFLGATHWPSAFQEAYALPGEASPDQLLPILADLWAAHGATWIARLERIPREHHPALAARVEERLPSLAAFLAKDLIATGPTADEAAFLWPDLEVPWKEHPRKEGWIRTLLGLEVDLGPQALVGSGIPIRGQMDRLERFTHPDGTCFLRVVDYKTSRESSLKAYAEDEAPFSTHLQTPLYLHLVEAQYGLPATALLVPLREEAPAPFTKVLKRLGETEDWRSLLRERVARLWRRVLEGDFPPMPGEGCAYCTLAALCGRPVDLDTEEEA